MVMMMTMVHGRGEGNRPTVCTLGGLSQKACLERISLATTAHILVSGISKKERNQSLKHCKKVEIGARAAFENHVFMSKTSPGIAHVSATILRRTMPAATQSSAEELLNRTKVNHPAVAHTRTHIFVCVRGDVPVCPSPALSE